MADARDAFEAVNAADVTDAALLVGRFDNLVREVGELRGVIDRLVLSVTATSGEWREVRAELASIVDLIGRFHGRFEARADAADARIDALMVISNRHERRGEQHEKRLAALERKRKSAASVRAAIKPRKPRR